MFTYYLWVKTVKTGSVFWATMTALSYLYMVSAWGGYVFIINLIPLHVFFLLLMGRFSNRIYVGKFVNIVIFLYHFANFTFVQPLFQVIHHSSS